MNWIVGEEEENPNNYIRDEFDLIRFKREVRLKITKIVN